MEEKQKPFLATDCKKCEKFYQSKYKEPCCSAYKMILADTNKPLCKMGGGRVCLKSKLS